jgi:hypothetical protein
LNEDEDEYNNGDEDEHNTGTDESVSGMSD